MRSESLLTIVPVDEVEVVRDPLDGQRGLRRVVVTQKGIVTGVETEEHIAIGDDIECLTTSALSLSGYATHLQMHGSRPRSRQMALTLER